MSNTIYGNLITSGNYNICCYCIYNDAVVSDTEVSIDILEVGFKRGGNSLTLSMTNCYCTSNADDYTEVKTTTSGSWTTSTGTRAVITADRTFTWERTNVEQTKTVTLTSVKPSGTLSGTSTITITVTIPALPQTSSNVKVKSGGSWVDGTVYVKISGTWQEASEVKVKSNGSWS